MEMMSMSRTAKILAAALQIGDENDRENVSYDRENVASFSSCDLDNMPFDIIEFDSLSGVKLDQVTTMNCLTFSEDNGNINILDGQINTNNIEDQLDNTTVCILEDNFVCVDDTSVEENNPSLSTVAHAKFSIPDNTSVKLVDYDTSSEEESQKENLVPPTQGKPKLFKRFSSDTSYFDDSNKDPDFNLTDENCDSEWEEEEGIVGNNSGRKKRKISKKSIQKAGRIFGKERQVNNIPCKANCQNKCAEKFTEINRHEIHEFYWGLGCYERQRNWLLSCMENIPIRRRIAEKSVSRRQNSFKYFINWNDRHVEVCQQFLLKTLDISQMTLRYAFFNSVQKSAKPDNRGKHEPHNKTRFEIKQEVHNFIKKLPAVPSHYCRNKSSRKYLPSDLRNISFLYRIFLKHQQSEDSNAIPSLKVFREIFQKDFNLGFHLPKKDKCRMCESRKDSNFKETDASKGAFSKHLAEKEESKELFLSDQKRHLTDDSYICASFDLEKVINTPHGDNLLLYYSRKYSFYNETVYESGTRNGFCYIWGESDGNRGCNEVSTIIFKYLQHVDDRGFKHVVLYSDSCSGQNRNRAMLLMIQKFLQEFSNNMETIKIVFLLPGHTYMPVDSVHAVIERTIKNKIVWAPSEWDTILTNARILPKPYEVIRMQYSDFYNWKKLGDECLPSNTKTSNGQLFKISLLRQAIFEKGNPNIEVNYTYGVNLNLKLSLAQRNNRRKSQRDIFSSVLYSSKLPISQLKKRDLDDLCMKNIIPKKYHQEYLDLRCKASVIDALPETDMEDTDNENNAGA